MRKLRDLLSRGYFPRELPPVYDTSSMRRVATMVNAAPASFWSTTRTSELCQHNVPRSGTLRRPLAIPNPVGYANLCREIDNSWREISRHISKSAISKSTPQFYTAGARAVLPEIPNQADLVPFRALARSSGKTILSTDISRLEKTTDCTVALMTLHARELNVLPAPLDTSAWENSMTTDELYASNWLISYEAGLRGWLPSIGRHDHISRDPNFDWLRNLGVSFMMTQW